MNRIKQIVLFLVITLLTCIVLSSCDIDGVENTSYKDHVPSILTYYDVNYYTNGGTKLEKQSIKENAYLEYAPEVYKSYHQFDGWYLDATFTQPAVFPIKMEHNVNLYAKWLKVYSKGSCENAVIKFWGDNDFSAIYDITPSGYDIKRLEELGYKLKINVTYDVFYKKDYDVPFDIGYAGAPKYEAYILRSDGLGYGDEDLSTSKNSKTRELDATIKISDFKNDKLKLSFSTDNIQNKIYFENIKVTYEFVK